MRILIVDPDNVDVFANIDPINSAPMKGQIQTVSNLLDGIRKQLDSTQQDRLEVRLLKEEKLTISMLCFDGLALVSIYLHSRYIDETPSMIVEGTTKPLYKTFTREFEYYFQRESPFGDPAS